MCAGYITQNSLHTVQELNSTIDMSVHVCHLAHIPVDYIHAMCAM